MAYQGSGGLQGVQGGVRGHQGALGASRLLPMPKLVIKEQNNGSKPWLKYPKCVLTQNGWYLLISEAFWVI